MFIWVILRLNTEFQPSTMPNMEINKLSQVGWLRRLCGGMVAEAMCGRVAGSTENKTNSAVAQLSWDLG